TSDTPNTPSDTTNTPSDIPNTPSGNTPPTSDIPSPIIDEEWNELKQNFISQYLPNIQPNDYKSVNSPTNTNNTTMSRDIVDNNTHPTMSHDNVDNNTHPTPSRDTLDQKPFIRSIHNRNLLSGEEISYNVNMSTNSMDDPKYISNNVYSGIDLINDTLSGNKHIDIYDEVLKRKENELFGTNHVKQTSTYSVAKNTNSDPIMNQLDLFHKWLDRHRDMCEQWDKNNKVEMLDKLKEKWDNETPTSGNKQSDIPSGKLSDTPSSNKILNSDVSIQIDMYNPKTTNEFTYVDSNPNLTLPSNPNPVENQNIVDSNTPSHVQIQMSVKNTQMVKEKYTISDMWDI
ncbi:erythrocyte membrane protein 1, EMP1, partial [Plasmodium reichenowi]